MFTIENGDILDKKCKIICQQVNCQGVMAAGLAKQIRNEYPAIFDEYRSFLNSFSDKSKALGMVHKFIAPDGRIIFNLFGQYSFGRDKQYTDYNALKSGFENIKKMLNKNDTLYIPYKIGCGLGGGLWVRVSDIIYNVFRGQKNNIVIVRHKQ